MLGWNCVFSSKKTKICKKSNHCLSVYSVAGFCRCSHLPLLRTLSTTTPLRQRIPGSLWKLGKLNHIAIAVPDMEKATALYRDVLGAKVSEMVPLPEHGVYTVFVELGNTKLELLHPLGEKSPITGFLQKNKSGGMHHICIEVRRHWSVPRSTDDMAESFWNNFFYISKHIKGFKRSGMIMA